VSGASACGRTLPSPPGLASTAAAAAAVVCSVAPPRPPPPVLCVPALPPFLAPHLSPPPPTTPPPSRPQIGCAARAAPAPLLPATGRTPRRGAPPSPVHSVSRERAPVALLPAPSTQELTKSNRLSTARSVRGLAWRGPRGQGQRVGQRAGAAGRGLCGRAQTEGLLPTLDRIQGWKELRGAWRCNVGAAPARPAGAAPFETGSKSACVESLCQVCPVSSKRLAPGAREVPQQGHRSGIGADGSTASKPLRTGGVGAELTAGRWAPPGAGRQAAAKSAGSGRPGRSKQRAVARQS
jgi:hypothetical protein